MHRLVLEKKSKMYSLMTVDGEEVKKAKGVNRNAIKNMRHIMKRIQSKFHKIGTYDVCKISLPYFDDKRYILGDGINSLAYFQKDIRSQ